MTKAHFQANEKEKASVGVDCALDGAHESLILEITLEDRNCYRYPSAGEARAGVQLDPVPRLTPQFKPLSHLLFGEASHPTSSISVRSEGHPLSHKVESCAMFHPVTSVKVAD